MSKEIQLTQGKVAIVDDADYEWLNQWKWCAAQNHHTWYAVRAEWRNGKCIGILMHREILQIPLGMETDHKDHNGLNNQRYNLRAATQTQNRRNRRKCTEFSSRYKGVSWRQDTAKWQAQIEVNKETFYLGCFLSETEAAQAYDEAARKFHNDFACLNGVPVYPKT